MACLEMYNKNKSSSDQNNNKLYSMSPRISFSNDFIDSSTNSSQHNERRDSYSPVSSDFEFSVTNYTMLTADQLFSKGRLLPFKHTHKTTTIRDELQNDDDFTLTIPKSSTTWKGLLGIKKSKKKHEKTPHSTKQGYNESGNGTDMDFRFN
ncbi:uncharacterized protein LOC107010405 [Solanum pennellii]|uniref:Uncharacterized protein LOC107010405 n=1 Tax=Solanum pennellii TaxID=28526 RepID=A0ABM1G2Q8_SOLPN|nr:uncharacterized protein LOC107010405 [Solanum pennellii]